MMTSIDTAVPLLEKNDLEQPLLIETTNTTTITNTEEEDSRWSNLYLGDGDGDDDDEEDGQETRTSSTAASCWGQRLLTSWQFRNGFWLGFIIQSVSLGSTAIIATHSSAALESPESWISETRDLHLTPMFYVVFFFLSQSWWLLFPVICIAIDGGLTGNRGRGILEKYFVSSSNSNSNTSNDDDDSSSSSSSSSSQPSQREVFLGGVRFHVGMVFGCFIVWCGIDLYLGAPLGVFAILFASLLGCLTLCYGMVVIHDRFIINE